MTFLPAVLVALAAQGLVMLWQVSTDIVRSALPALVHMVDRSQFESLAPSRSARRLRLLVLVTVFRSLSPKTASSILEHSIKSPLMAELQLVEALAWAFIPALIALGYQRALVVL